MTTDDDLAFDEVDIPTGDRIPKSLTETAAFGKAWSDYDRQRIRDEWARLGVVSAYQPSTRSLYVVMLDGARRALAWVGGGRLEYGKDVEETPDDVIVIANPQGKPRRILPLSNYQNGTERNLNEEGPVKTCPTCNYALPLSGTCDNCG